MGGEQSGHIILANYSTTGDGILSSVKLAELVSRKKLSVLAKMRLLPQYNVSVKVKDKVRVLGNEGVQAASGEAEKLAERVVVRASGTEPVVRIFAEAESMRAAREAAELVRRAIAKSEE